MIANLNGVVWIRSLAVVVVLISALAGCQSVQSGVGGFVLEENRVTLPEGRTGVQAWRSRDLTMRYELGRGAGDMRLMGEIRFADHLVYNFSNIVYFHASLLLLDGSGRVIEERPLVSSGPMSSDGTLSLDRSFSLPAGVSSMAFSYRGEAVSSGSDGAGPTYFWHYPIR